MLESEIIGKLISVCGFEFRAALSLASNDKPQAMRIIERTTTKQIHSTTERTARVKIDSGGEIDISIDKDGVITHG